MGFHDKDAREHPFPSHAQRSHKMNKANTMKSKLAFPFLSLLIVCCSIPAAARGVRGNAPSRRRVKEDKKSKEGSGGGVTGCGDIENLELFDYVVEDHIDDIDSPCVGRDEGECLTLAEVQVQYPGIEGFERTECLSPDDCEGECRVHSSGLVCDESRGPFLQLFPLCGDNVVIIPPLPPQDTEPPETEEPTEPPEPTDPTEPPVPTEPPEPEEPENAENDKTKFLGAQPRFRHRIDGVTSFSAQP